MMPISSKKTPLEAVVKVAFYVKSPQGAKNIAHYIAHGSEGLEKYARVFDDENRLIHSIKPNKKIEIANGVTRSTASDGTVTGKMKEIAAA